MKTLIPKVHWNKKIVVYLIVQDLKNQKNRKRNPLIEYQAKENCDTCKIRCLPTRVQSINNHPINKQERKMIGLLRGNEILHLNFDY